MSKTFNEKNKTKHNTVSLQGEMCFFLEGGKEDREGEGKRIRETYMKE